MKRKFPGFCTVLLAVFCLSALPTKINEQDLPSFGWVTNGIPTQTFWDGLFPLDHEGDTATGQTALYHALGQEIKHGYNASTSIQYACIYYNPAPGNFETPQNWQNAAMHEIGHCLGFGHYTKEVTLMSISNTNHTVPSRYDKDCFRAKY